MVLRDVRLANVKGPWFKGTRTSTTDAEHSRDVVARVGGAIGSTACVTHPTMKGKTMTDNLITLDRTDANVKGILTQINGEVKSATFYAAYVSNHKVTRDDVADHARAFADAWLDTYGNASDRKTGPVQKSNGTRTRYGNAVQAAGKGLRNALPEDEQTPKEVVLRVSLSGEGGGSTTVPADHPLYADIVALLG